MHFTYVTQFAAAYNCTDSSSQSYGAGSYGTCNGMPIGAPNTGEFNAFITSAVPTILVPLAAALILAIIATIVVKRKNRAN